ncbi:hypothetical protein BC826DRAFT_972766 [Russula brevipes]|nr:hypothetical protein BC826DRAFT_972766 [Russula brevipes]
MTSLQGGSPQESRSQVVPAPHRSVAYVWASWPYTQPRLCTVAVPLPPPSDSEVGALNPSGGLGPKAHPASPVALCPQDAAFSLTLALGPFDDVITSSGSCPGYWPLGLLRNWSGSCLRAGTRTSSPSIICRSGASLRGMGMDMGMGHIRLCQQVALGLLHNWSGSCLCAGTRTSSSSIIHRSGASLRGTSMGMGRIHLCQRVGQVGFAPLQVLCTLVAIEWAEELLLFIQYVLPCGDWRESKGEGKFFEKGVWARRERVGGSGRKKHGFWASLGSFEPRLEGLAQALQTSSRALKPAKLPPRPSPAWAFTARLPGLDGFGPGLVHHYI